MSYGPEDHMGVELFGMAVKRKHREHNRKCDGIGKLDRIGFSKERPRVRLRKESQNLQRMFLAVHTETGYKRGTLVSCTGSWRGAAPGPFRGCCQ